MNRLELEGRLRSAAAEGRMVKVSPDHWGRATYGAMWVTAGDAEAEAGRLAGGATTLWVTVRQEGGGLRRVMVHLDHVIEARTEAGR